MVCKRAALRARYTEGATWLDRMQAQEMAKAFPGYMRKIADPQWQETVYTAIHWYTRTNGTAPGVDGSVVLVQAALERLAWQVLVHDKGIFPRVSSLGYPRPTRYDCS